MRSLKQTKSNKLFRIISLLSIVSWIIYFIKKLPRTTIQRKVFHENSTLEDHFEELSPEKMKNEKFMIQFLSNKMNEYESFLLNHSDDETCYLCTQMENHIININGQDFEHSKTSIDGNSIHLIKAPVSD